MLLYHGTPSRFNEPSLEMCKPHRDFGCGFYLAQNYYDALPLSIKHSSSGFVYTYELSDTDGLSTIVLDGYSDEWLNLVVRARLGSPPNVDLVIGNMAGGGANLKSKFSKFRNSNTPVQEVSAIMRSELTNTNLGIQYAFLTSKALSKLRIIDIEIIEREDVV